MIVIIPFFEACSLDLTSFQTFPSYLWMYLQHLCVMQTFDFLTLGLLLVKDSQLLAFVIHNLQEVLLRFEI